MTEEKEIVPETNGEEETNGKKSTAEESIADETNDEKTGDDVSDLEFEIIRQIEYYFGDINLPRDKFLSEQTKLDDGWVPLELLTKFNRLSKICSDIEVIENALKKSKSGLLEIADKKIRRNPDNPLPEYNEERRKEMSSRTIYAKGFPKNWNLDDLLTFFKDYDGVENVIMRRYIDQRSKTRHFKGSVFVTFKTKEQAEKFLESKELKCNDNDLLVMWQSDYIIHKKEELATRRDKREKKMKSEKEEKPKPDLNLPTGAVLFFENSNEKLTREDIRSALSDKDSNLDLAFIDFKLGLKKGYIRFTKENGAIEFLKTVDDKSLMFGTAKVELRLLEGDEEKEYLTKTVEEMAQRRKNMKIYKQKGKSNYKGKHMKRRREPNSEDGPPAKVKCDS